MTGYIAAVVLSLVSLPGFARDHNPNDSPNQLSFDTTFGTVRRAFLNRRVVVTGIVANRRPSVLVDWAVAGRRSSGRYMTLSLDKLSSTYRGKRAKVVAVQLHGLERRTFNPTNGVPDDEVVNPYFEIVVQFLDGALAICTSYSLTIERDIELVYDAEAR